MDWGVQSLSGRGDSFWGIWDKSQFSRALEAAWQKQRDLLGSFIRCYWERPKNRETCLWGAMLTGYTAVLVKWSIYKNKIQGKEQFNFQPRNLFQHSLFHGEYKMGLRFPKCLCLSCLQTFCTGGSLCSDALCPLSMGFSRHEYWSTWWS